MIARRVAVAAAAASLGLTACGGGQETPQLAGRTAPAQLAATQTATTQGTRAPARHRRGAPTPVGPHSPVVGHARVTQAPAPGSSTPARRLSGSDGSIEAYGTEASSSDTTAIADLLIAYERAAADHDTRRACQLLATSIAAGYLKTLGTAATKAKPTCESILGPLLAPPPAPVRHAMLATRVLAVRVKDDRGYALFDQPGVGQGFLPVIREGSTWKAGAISESLFPAPPPSHRRAGSHGASRSPSGTAPPLPKIGSESVKG